MRRTLIKDLGEHIGSEVKVSGFLEVLRNQGKIAFLIVRDVSGVIQAVVVKNDNPDVFENLDDLSIESVVEVVGMLKEEKQAPGGFEIALKEYKVLSKAHPELPIPVVLGKGGEETEMSKRFDWRAIDLRKKERREIFKVWTAFEKGIREHYLENDFLQVYAPSLLNAPSESGAEVFEVKYFERTAYLAQSPQFHKQAAMAAGFEKVFIHGPVFRAEPSFTTRHMTEFTGWDFEISYIEDHHEVMDELEKVMVKGFEALKAEVMPELEVPVSPFPRITMEEAKAKLKEAGVKSEKEGDVSPEEERELCRLIKEEMGSDFVFLTDYPIDVRPFYHMRYEDNPSITMSYDLLFKGIEIVTGAQREHRYDVLVAQAKEKDMSLELLEPYLNFFKYGCPPHGGAGIGPGRIIMKLLEQSSVKETAFMPRDVKRLTP